MRNIGKSYVQEVVEKNLHTYSSFFHLVHEELPIVSNKYPSRDVVNATMGERAVIRIDAFIYFSDFFSKFWILY